MCRLLSDAHKGLSLQVPTPSLQHSDVPASPATHGAVPAGLMSLPSQTCAARAPSSTTTTSSSASPSACGSPPGFPPLVATPRMFPVPIIKHVYTHQEPAVVPAASSPAAAPAISGGPPVAPLPKGAGCSTCTQPALHGIACEERLPDSSHLPCHTAVSRAQDLPRHSRANVVKGKWILKHKFNVDGSLEQYKARWPVNQLDVKNVFIHGTLTETIYRAQTSGFEDTTNPDIICHLNKSLYGLKQAPCAWYSLFATYLVSLGFVEAKSETSLCVYRQLYIDDIVLTTSTPSLLRQIISAL